MKKSRLDLEHEDIKYKGKANNNTQRFLITAAVAGAPVHKAFLDSCEAWCSQNKAELIILSCRSHAQAFEGQAPIFDSHLDRHFIDGTMFREFKINSNLRVIDAQHNPQLLNPQNSLYKFGNSNIKYTVINAHPSQNAITIASGNDIHPRRVVNTGVCTLPRYRKNAIGILAEKHHIIGGLVVELLDDRVFFIRQIQSRKDGSFCLNGKVFSSDKSKIKPVKSGLVLGDLHPEVIDEDAVNATIDQIKLLKPELLVFHDWMDNTVINPHTRKNYVKRALLSHHSISESFKACKLVITKLKQSVPNAELVFVNSNHCNWLDTYLETGEFLKDVVNLPVLVDLFQRKLKLPEESIYKELFNFGDKAQFLSRRIDYFYGGHNLALHGDKGVAGKRGNLETFNKYLGNCVVGHTHSHSILGQAKQVGHLSKKFHGYNDTLNDWTQGNGVVYEDGSYSELLIIDGEWGLK